jgi:hypothetical protein
MPFECERLDRVPRICVTGKVLDAVTGHHHTEGGQIFEYRMTIKSRDRRAAETLAQYLRNRSEVLEFRIAPTGD